MRILIDDTNINTKSGTDKNGRPYAIRSQAGYLDTGKRYPAEIKIRLKDDALAFPVGEYEVNLAASTYVSKYGSLAMSEELVLVAVNAPKLAAAK
jgi:hypothetical protein